MEDEGPKSFLNWLEQTLPWIFFKIVPPQLMI